MTVEELNHLVFLMQGRDLTQPALAKRLIEIYTELAEAKQLIRQLRMDAKRRTERQREAQIQQLEQRLASKEKALDFSVRRTEVLRRQLAEALGGQASRPAHALGGPTT